MRKFLQKLAFLTISLLTSLGWGQTVTVTADLKSMFAGNQATKTQVCFSLVDAGGQQIPDPRVIGTGIIVPTSQQCVSPDANGHISTTVYANDQISPAGSLYSVQYTFNGRTVHGDLFSFALVDVTDNLNTKAPITTVPLIQPPSGDSTYLRKDGGNLPLTVPFVVNSANGTDMFSSTRATDSSPSGNFVNFKSLAGISLFKIGIDGSITSAGSATINGNTIIKGPRPYVDVTAFGAVGDGVTDDTTPIQNAINFACSGGITAPAGNVCVTNGGAAPVYFPAAPNANSCYKTTAPLNIYSTSTLFGAGTTSSKICKTTNTVGSGSITAGSGVGRTPTSCSGGPCVDSFAVDSIVSVLYPSAGNTGYATMWRVRDIGLFCQATNGCTYGIYAPRATRFEVKATYIFGNCANGNPTGCGGVVGYAFYTHDSFLYRLEGNIFEDWAFGPAHVNDGSGAGTGTSATLYNNFANLIGRSCYSSYGLSYSTWTGNACDNFNVGNVDLTALGNDFTAYSFVLSQGITISGGGAEAIHGGVITSDGSTVTVSGGFKTFNNTGYTAAGSFPGIIVIDNVAGGGITPSLTIQGTVFSAMTSPGNFLNIILQDGGSLIDINSVLPSGAGAFIGYGGGALETDMNASGITMTNSVGASLYAPGVISLRETTAPAGAGSVDKQWPDSVAHRWKMNNNNGGADSVVGAATTDIFSNKSTAAGPLTGTVASGTAAMTTALIAAGACGTTVTVAATGVATTDVINDDFNTSVTAANNGLLIFHKWATAGNVNFNYCNPGAAGITPTAMTVNWQVTR